MNLVKFKDFTQKINFLKNYSSLLVPMIIMLVGIFLFVPTQLISRGLKKQVEDESVSVGQRLKSMSNSMVARDQWKVEQDYQRAFAEDANKTSLIIKHSSQRQLISYKIFPEPKDTSTLIFKEFGQRYRELIDEHLVRMNAHDCPTETDISRSLQKGSMIVGSDSSRQTGKTSEVDMTIIDALCISRARSSAVYINPADIAGYTWWENYEYVGMEPAVQDCWFWQMGYWVIEDVLDTIAKCNSGSASVFDSKVKRLLTVDFAARNTAPAKKAETRPSYVTSAQNAIILPYTGRVSNNDIDVIQFEVSVIVGAKEVIPFMRQLCGAKPHRFRGFFNDAEEQVYKHNQITILGADMVSIDPADPAQRLYRYGDDAVVKLNLFCEYIFDKGVYDAIKPASIKQQPGAGKSIK